MKKSISLQTRSYQWAQQKVVSRWAGWWLFIIFFSEILFFIPLDPILAFYCIERPEKRTSFVGIATLASALAGCVGYTIGAFLWYWISPYLLDHLISTSLFEKIQKYYLDFEGYAVAIGSFLPLPFKVITLTAGACQLPFGLFLMGILLGRYARFYGLSRLLTSQKFQIKGWLQKYFFSNAALLAGKLVLAIGAIWMFR
ncbi:MAG: hypothetical protein EBZ47_02830 [Chlamydiae bacterium]|nr:hypothetical protein [Chlamydiota bacterium]